MQQATGKISKYLRKHPDAVKHLQGRRREADVDMDAQEEEEGFDFVGTYLSLIFTCGVRAS